MCLGTIVSAQTFTDSNLPIVIITTDGGASIPNEPGVLGNMKIIYRGPGQRNYLTDQTNPDFLNYNGRIDIEKRGSSSQGLNKSNYGFTTLQADNSTNNNVSLLGMPEENDWILGGMVFDTALVRDHLCHTLFRKLGNYSSRTAYCEVVLNGDYRGLYVLEEKIKADDNRVDVIKIASTDNSGEALTGGYITKADKTTGGDPVAWTMNAYNSTPSNPVLANYIHHLPKPELVTTTQTNYIKGEFFRLESTAMNNNISPLNGYPSVIDVPSFIDFMIINEIASNPDAYQFSTFFHKDRNGKLRAGPIWDLDLSFGNDLKLWGYDRSKTNLWYFEDYYYNNGSRFWRDLFRNSTFKCYLSKRWNELTQTGQPLNIVTLETFLDQTYETISEAAAREYIRWSKLGSLEQRFNDIKTFLTARIAWMTTNLGSYANCSNVPVPPLVITRINYHPAISVQFPDDDKLEFLEIRNNGTTTVNLSGVYFLGTGLVYRFPENSTLGPHLCVIIASDIVSFQSKYGFTPYGHFTRHLSNSDESLILADAFGNIIDSVYYFDVSPWPDADGNGYYLKLADVDLDNSQATNWIASNDVITSGDEIPIMPVIQIYPNPVDDYLRIESESEILSLTINDIQGRTLLSVGVNCESYELDMRNFIKGTYIVRITTTISTYTEKIIKH